jgi:prolipoprotein diacylglyceryltransferase
MLLLQLLVLQTRPSTSFRLHLYDLLLENRFWNGGMLYRGGVLCAGLAAKILNEEINY